MVVAAEVDTKVTLAFMSCGTPPNTVAGLQPFMEKSL